MEPVKSYHLQVNTWIFKCTNHNKVIEFFQFIEKNQSNELNEALNAAETKHFTERFFKLEGNSNFTPDQENYIDSVCKQNAHRDYDFFDSIIMRIQNRKPFVNEKNLREIYKQGVETNNIALRNSCYKFLGTETGFWISEDSLMKNSMRVNSADTLYSPEMVLSYGFTGVFNQARFEVVFPLIRDLIPKMSWYIKDLECDQIDRFLEVFAPCVQSVSIEFREVLDDCLQACPFIKEITIHHSIGENDIPTIKKYLERGVTVKLTKPSIPRDLIIMAIEGKSIIIPGVNFTLSVLTNQYFESNLEKVLRYYLQLDCPTTDRFFFQLDSEARNQKIIEFFAKNYRDPLFYKKYAFFREIDSEKVYALFLPICEEEFKEPVTSENVSRKIIVSFLASHAPLWRNCEQFVEQKIAIALQNHLSNEASIAVTIAKGQYSKERLLNFAKNTTHDTALFNSVKKITITDAPEISDDFIHHVLKSRAYLKTISFINCNLTIKNISQLLVHDILIETKGVSSNDVKKYLLLRAINDEHVVCRDKDAFELLDVGTVTEFFLKILNLFTQMCPESELPIKLIENRGIFFYLITLLDNQHNLPEILIKQALTITEERLPKASDMMYRSLLVRLNEVLALSSIAKIDPVIVQLIKIILKHIPVELRSLTIYMGAMSLMELPIPEDTVNDENVLQIIDSAQAVACNYAFVACEKFIHHEYGVKVNLHDSSCVRVDSVDEGKDVVQIIQILKKLLLRYKNIKTSSLLLSLKIIDQQALYQELNGSFLTVDYKPSQNDFSVSLFTMLRANGRMLSTLRLYNVDLKELVEHKEFQSILNFINEETEIVFINCKNPMFTANKLKFGAIVFDNTPWSNNVYNISAKTITIRNMPIDHIDRISFTRADQQLILDNVTLSAAAQKSLCTFMLTRLVTLRNTKVDVDYMLAIKLKSEGFDKLVMSRPAILEQLLAYFPPSVKENIPLYNAFCNTEHAMHGKSVYVKLSLVTLAALHYPHHILGILGNIQRITSLKVNFYDTIGNDANGLTREFFAKLIQGLIINHNNQLTFEKNPRDLKFLPVVHDVTCNYLETLGMLMVFIANSGGQFQIGEIFPERFFKALTNLKVHEFTSMQDDRLYEVCSILYDDHEHQQFFDHINNIRNLTVDDVLTEQQKQFYMLQFVPEDDIIPSIDVIKQDLEDTYLPILRKKVIPLQKLAIGINNALPIDIRSFVFANWDMLSTDPKENVIPPCEILDYLIQGRFTKEKFIELLEVESHRPMSDKRLAEVKTWIIKWINAHTLDEVKKVVQAITGAPTSAIRIKFKMHDITNFHLHTCFNLVDIPEDVTEEVLLQEMTEWSKGKHLGYNRS